MPTYVVLYKFTDQGRKKVKDTVKRAAQVRRQNERRGFKVLGTWWTQGQYDIVAALEAPSEEAMLSGLFNVAEAGNVASETLRAYSDKEMERILKGGGATSPRRATRATTTRRRTTRTAARRRAS
jgi:uncharacterized protein with GYD domain